MKKVGIRAMFSDRTIRKGGENNWYGLRKQSVDLPPMYDYTSENRAYDYAQPEKPDLTPQLAPALSDEQVKQLRTAVQLTSTGSPRQTMEPITQRGFTPNQEYSRLVIANSTESDSDYNTFDRKASGITIPDYNNTYNTNNTSNLYQPDQRENNHLSYLSSLSSGFGDQIIIPEGVTQPEQAVQQNPRQSRKFSWVTGAKRYGDRDTMMTTSSVDTAPRFRTVMSWVAQQSGRVQKKDDEVPKVPDLPLPLQIGSQSVPNHQRNLSEDPAFRHHPGEEVPYLQGSRVPSAILDRKTGVNQPSS
jgi:hypothetical protein